MIAAARTNPSRVLEDSYENFMQRGISDIETLRQAASGVEGIE
jgi:hypothetical protein